MDDTEDDARYLPNHPYSSIRRRPFSSSSTSSSSPHQSKISAARKSSFPPPISRRYADEDDEDEQNDMDEAVDEHDDDEDEYDGSGRHRQIRDEEEEEDSAESRGKRRKVDKFALGFEFVPRVPRPAVGTPEGKFPAKSSPTDWSEDSTLVLLDAWGDIYVKNGRKSLRSDEWSEVAKKVSQSSRATRSDAQCRNRLDTLKKKYKKEKVRMAEHASSISKWVYFKKMDALMSPPPPPPAGVRQLQPPQLPCGVDAGEYVFASSNVYLNRSNDNEEMRDSPGDTGSEEDGNEEEEDDESPPPTREKVSSRRTDSSFRMLADSVQKFGETYEKMESRKRLQIAELERMRKEFQRDLEMHKRKILEKAQAEIAKIMEEEGEEEEKEEEEEKSEDDQDRDDEIDVSAENLSG